MYTYLNTEKDERSNCFSLLSEMKLQDYFSLISFAYDAQGQIGGQRDKLTSTSAIRIRARMVEDFRKNAVFPAVAIGIIVDDSKFNGVAEIKSDENLELFLKSLSKESFSIIDGMQRTTVYKDCIDTSKERKIRVEFWVTKRTESLTYRMLVLNTGQVPWNLRRQIEVVYAPLIEEIKNRLKVKQPGISERVQFIHIDDNGARLNAGQFHADDIVEMYLSFGLRKEKIDTASVLAEDFTRLDLIEALANDNFLEYFISVFACLAKLDLAFSEVVRTPFENDQGKINIGRKIFDSMPAKIGFMVASSQLIFGRVGTHRSNDEQTKAIGKIEIAIGKLVEKIQGLKTPQEKELFFCFSILNERIKTAPTNRIGDWQRAFYLEAFRIILLDEFDFQSLEASWRAY